MSRDREHRIETIFQEVLDLPAGEREAALDGLCGDDDELRQHVRTLVAHYEDAQPNFLDRPVFADATSGDDVPQSIGPYQVVGRIGEGGMGVVYEAQQTRPKRRIAIKVLRPGLYGKAQLSRFRRECDALGRLNHTGIAAVYDAGTAEVTFADHPSVELPYLAMERVDGSNLLDHAEEARLDQRARLELFAEACDAVHHAHEHDVIHRDLKPSNILVDPSGQPKILDFGVARIRADADHTRQTRTGDIIGTPRYMSPEQLLGDRAVDARSDVYSLGVILFKMLSGESPFGTAETSITDRLRWYEGGCVPEITKHDPTLRGDLDAIVRMALSKEPEKRYSSAAELADDVRRYVRGERVLAPSEGRGNAWRRVLRRHRAVLSVAATLVLTLTTIMLVMNPFKARHSDANTGDNKLAIMYFDNLAEPNDKDRRGEMVTELLITGLSQSEHFQVISSQRLYDLLKLLGKGGETKIDRSTATELARRAGADWMMLGQVLQTEHSFAVASQIVDVETGNVTASLRTTGRVGETIFSIVDRIAAETLRTLGVPGSPHAPTTSVAAVSTASEEAYRYYLAGIENERKLFDREARENFLKALDIDSTFAMAAFHVGEERYLRQALRHADRASPKEQMYLRAATAVLARNPRQKVSAFEAVIENYPDDKYALERLTWFSEAEKAIAYGKRLVELDPLNKIAYCALGYAYCRGGELGKAIWAIDKYVELAPDEPNPYDSKGEIYAAYGRIDDAIAAYKKAAEISPDFGGKALGDLYAFKGDYDEAEALYRRLFSSSDAQRRAKGRRLLTNLLAYRGRITEALDQIDVAVKVGQMEGVDGGEISRTLAMRGVFLYAIGDKEQAARAVERATELLDLSEDRSLLKTASRFAGVGRPEEADEYLAKVETRIANLSEIDLERYYIVKGEVESARRNYGSAIEYMVKSPPAGMWVRFSSRLPTIEAHFEAGRWNDVIALAEPIATCYKNDGYGTTLLDFPLVAARLHYQLAVAYQEVGRSADAVDKFEMFLSIWQDADPRLEGPEDARERLAVLKRGS